MDGKEVRFGFKLIRRFLRRLIGKGKGFVKDFGNWIGIWGFVKNGLFILNPS